jgi:SAM-dependent methyltransferase
MSAETEWYEDDRFWAMWAPFMFTADMWERTPAQVDKILALLEPAAGAAVLDLACGPGRHALEFARRGFRVTGLDRTRSYLSAAAERARVESLEVEFVHGDMRQFIRSEAFDAAICVFTSFGYFDDAEDDLRVLRNLRESLKTGGKLLLDLIGKEALAAVFEPRGWSEADGVIRLEERRIIDDWSRISCRWIRIDGASREEFLFTHRLYSASEMRAWLVRAGFSAVTIYGAIDGIPYDHNARRLVAVATK